jgi:transposase
LDVHLILDNYGTHKTDLIHNWLAKRPRFHLHFTPTLASWLNLVERWFANLTEKQLRRGVHRSTKELERAIRDYIDHNNQNPKPLIWHKSADQILDSHPPSFVGSVPTCHRRRVELPFRSERRA